MTFFQRHLGWAVLASELSHVFCCVLPTLVTVLGALANIGLVTFAPHIIMDVHRFLHEYELSIIGFSAFMVAIGWIIHLASTKVDCHDTGCVHPPCTPQKNNNARILIIATLLFAANLIVYFGIHRNVLGLDMFRINADAYMHELHDGHEE